MCAISHETSSIKPGPAAAQATETALKGTDLFIQGPIGEGPAVEEQGIYFPGAPPALASQARLLQNL